MDVSVLINIGAVTVSIAAAAVSARVASRQFRAQRHGNYVEPMTRLLGEFRSLEFHERYAFIRTELPKLSPENGISGLDREAQEAIYDIGYLFQHYAILAGLDVLDGDFLGRLLRRRYVEVWTSLAPFVRRERELRGLPDEAILKWLEEFASHLEAVESKPTTEYMAWRESAGWRPRLPR